MPRHFLLAFMLALGMASDSLAATEPLMVNSPNGSLRLTFNLDQNNEPTFQVAYRDRVVATGTLGLEFAGSGPLGEDLKILGTSRTDRDETYEIPVGKFSKARDRHREFVIELEEQNRSKRKVEIGFRAFDDGVAFRYRIPKQEALQEFVLTDELTRLTFPGDPKARVLPLESYTTPYEKYYEALPVSAIGENRLLGLPLLLERSTGGSKPVWIAVTEANLTDYAGMYLSGAKDPPGTLISKLSPLPGRTDRAKVLGKAPHASPSRVLLIAEDPGRLIESQLVFHLSDPPRDQGHILDQAGQDHLSLVESLRP